MRISGSMVFFLLCVLVGISFQAHQGGWKEGMEDCLAAGPGCKVMYKGAK